MSIVGQELAKCQDCGIASMSMPYGALFTCIPCTGKRVQGEQAGELSHVQSEHGFSLGFHQETQGATSPSAQKVTFTTAGLNLADLENIVDDTAEPGEVKPEHSDPDTAIKLIVAEAQKQHPGKLRNKFGMMVAVGLLSSTRTMIVPSEDPAEPAQYVDVTALNLPPAMPPGSFTKIRDEMPHSLKSGHYGSKFMQQAQWAMTGQCRLEANHLQGANIAERKYALTVTASDTAGLLQVVEDSRRAALDVARNPDSMKTFLSHFFCWISFCMCLGICPYRWEWALRDDIPASTLAQEENLLAAYIDYLGVRCSSGDVLSSMFGAVRTFHADYLRLTMPTCMPRLKRVLALQTKKLLQGNPVRRVRSMLTVANALAILAFWESIAVDTNDPWKAVTYTMFQTIAAVALTAGFRIAELCPGAKFNNTRYWTLATLCLFLDIDPDNAKLSMRSMFVMPPQRKTTLSSKSANEAARRGFLYEDWHRSAENGTAPLCAAYQIRRLLARIQTAAASCTSLFKGKTLTQVAGSIPAFFHPPDPSAGSLKLEPMDSATMRGAMKTATEQVLQPELEKKRKFGCSCFRRTCNWWHQLAGTAADVRRAMHGRTENGAGTAEYDDLDVKHAALQSRKSFLVNQATAGVYASAIGPVDHSVMGSAGTRVTTEPQSEVQPGPPSKPKASVNPPAPASPQAPATASPPAAAEVANNFLSQSFHNELIAPGTIATGLPFNVDEMQQACTGMSTDRATFVKAYLLSGCTAANLSEALASANNAWQQSNRSPVQSQVDMAAEPQLDQDRHGTITALTKETTGLPRGWRAVECGGGGDCLVLSIAFVLTTITGLAITGVEIRQAVAVSLLYKITSDAAFAEFLYCAIQTTGSQDQRDGFTQEECAQPQLTALRGWIQRMATDGVYLSQLMLMEIASVYGRSVILYEYKNTPLKFSAPLSPKPDTKTMHVHPAEELQVLYLAGSEHYRAARPADVAAGVQPQLPSHLRPSLRSGANKQVQGTARIQGAEAGDKREASLREDEAADCGVAVKVPSAHAKPTPPAPLPVTQAAAGQAWQAICIGWVVALPGAVWGPYAQDEGTKDWADMHSADLFNVTITEWEPSTHTDSAGVFAVKHKKESSFGIRLGHIFQYLASNLQTCLLSVMPDRWRHTAEDDAWADLPPSAETIALAVEAGRKVLNEAPATSKRAIGLVIAAALAPAEIPTARIKILTDRLLTSTIKFKKLRDGGQTNALVPDFLRLTVGSTLMAASQICSTAKRALVRTLRKHDLRLDWSTVLGANGKPAGVGVFATATLGQTDIMQGVPYCGESYQMKDWAEHVASLIASGAPVQPAFDTVNQSITPYAVEDGGGFMICAQDEPACAPRYLQHSSDGELITHMLVTGFPGETDFPMLICVREVPAGTECFIDYNAHHTIKNGHIGLGGRSPEAEVVSHMTQALLASAAETVSSVPVGLRRLSDASVSAHDAAQATPAPWTKTVKLTARSAVSDDPTRLQRAPHNCRLAMDEVYMPHADMRCLLEAFRNITLVLSASDWQQCPGQPRDGSNIQIGDLENTPSALAAQRTGVTGFTQDTLSECVESLCDEPPQTFGSNTSSRNTQIDWAQKIQAAVLQTASHFTAIVKTGPEQYRHIDSMRLDNILFMTANDLHRFVSTRMDMPNVMIHVLPENFPVGDHPDSGTLTGTKRSADNLSSRGDSKLKLKKAKLGPK